LDFKSVVKKMKIKKKTLTLLTVCLLLLSAFTIITRNYTTTAQPSNGAELFGIAADGGKDTDGDGKYDYLEVAVEINVSVAGNYRIEAAYLVDQYDSWLYLFTYNESYLELGGHWFNLSFYGIGIYAQRFYPKGIPEIYLYDEYYIYLDSIMDVQLSRIYNYTEFDCGAVLTGTIYDEGIDTDGDMLLNSLQIGVEINVSDAATYKVNVDGLVDGVYIDVYNYSEAYLLSGIQTLNVSLNGAKIYASRGDVSRISSIYLYVLEDYRQYRLDYNYSCSLSKTYNYKEFDPLAFFTGIISDEGIDDDGDELFDYLKISVEINVTDAGYYGIWFENLVDNYSNYIYAYESFYSKFDVGVYLINLTVYGPKIYSSHIDPVYIERLILEVSFEWEWIGLDKEQMVPLPVLYNYTRFESHAFLTGKVYDKGVDTDADELFDCLEVGLEVNVTEAETYRISVGGLAEKLDMGAKYQGYYQYSVVDLDLGVHIINFTFPGPMIAYHHINPTNVTDLSLTEISTYYEVSYVPTVALSTRYNYTQFNSPLNDMQIELAVYPNATIGISGLFNHTRIYPIYPYNQQPSVNATLGFSTSGDLTTGSVNGTIMLPEYPYSYHEFPYNSTTVDFASKYYNGMLNAQLNATMLMPPAGSTTYPFNASDFSFLATYSDGVLNAHIWGETEIASYYASQFPFNVTDVTVLADYTDDEITGNITLHVLSGFPLEDVIIYFSGNRSEISFTGSADVIYGNYFGMEINSTILDDMLSNYTSTIPGQGPDSLYNMTDGLLECTALNTTKTPLDDYGARVDYNATISGNFTKLLATYLIQMLFGPYPPEEAYSIVYAALDATLSSVDHASLISNYYYGSRIASIDLTLSSDVKALWNNALQLVPPTVPPENRSLCEAWLKIANATAYAIDSVYIKADYSSTEQQLDLHASLTANVTQLENEVIPILPDAVPSEFRDFVESCINTTYCTLDSFNTTCNYVNGVIDFDAEWLLKGDFKTELNRIKSCYVEYLNLTSPYMINWQIRMLNATEIDISNLKADIRQGARAPRWMTFTFEGLRVHPIKDEVDFIRFKLYSLFNMTSDPYESPREFEKLKITIVGGSNATHTILLYAPSTVPTPNMTSLDYKIMTWENVTMSSMKDLLFKIAYQGVIPYLGKTYYVPIFTNSTVSNFFGLDPNGPSISFNVTGTPGTGFCNVTIPKALLDATLLEDWVVKIDGIQLTLGEYSATENAQYVFIYLNYSHSGHLIEIEGTWVITEFPPNVFPLILVIISLIAAIIAVKQRKKLGTLKTKYQSVIRTFANRLHELRT
jgi:hypothetical protein